MRLVGVVIVTLLIVGRPADAGRVPAPASADGRASLVLRILSSRTLSGTAGDYVTVEAQIRNASSKPVGDVTTYLSLADEKTKLPVDLEDWSAERGLFIGTIDAGQTLPLAWRIHFVTPGRYSLFIVAETTGRDYPQVSSISHFVVAPKRNLNPGQVLPVALGTPLILLALMLALTHGRNSRLTR